MRAFRSFLLLFVLSVLPYGQSLSAAEQFISFSSGDIDLSSPTIYIDNADQKGVAIAVSNLKDDFGRVTGRKAADADNADNANIIVGTLGSSKAIDALAKAGKIESKELKGKTEKYIIKVANGKLVIAGSDRRGTIFGVYELSRQIGVSPWYWWADVPTTHHDHVYALNGTYTDGEPAVRYRGIFLNDEAPCLTTWNHNTFGTNRGDHNFYAKCFELILRLKGNFMWPAMWGWSFYADDPLNSKTADEMGVVMGTSHHEPMARNHQEYSDEKDKWGPWNYNTNSTRLKEFFREGMERAKNTEDIITIGMRGDGDEAMSAEADTKLLERIVADQRKIISDVTGKPASRTPQVWALYKEVLDYYDKGMRVPDDVTILLCDDNWGNVRRVPNAKERNRKGGWGLYYHVDYVGAPRNTKWLNVTPTQNMWEQLSLAYEFGIQKLWVLNVGDLKPMEYPIQLFMDMAWNPRRYTVDNLMSHSEDFCRSAFGDSQAKEAARILNLQDKYAGRCTAEMLDATTYDLESGEWARVADEYNRLETDALRQYMTISPDARDCYRELILFPVQAMSNIYQMYYAQAMNNALYKAGNPEANVWADRTEQAFKRDSILCRQYNKDIANGKWDGMMIQKHIGYTSWNDNFPKDICPKVMRIDNETDGGRVFTETDGSVIMEAAHYNNAQASEGTKWTVIPFIGRAADGIALMPYTSPVGDSKLEYVFNSSTDADSVDVHIITRSTLDFLNKGGLVYNVSLDGNGVDVNFNRELNEQPENIHRIYYPTVARRTVESVVRLPIGNASQHKLILHPLDPGIVFEKIVIDFGGYRNQYLFGQESPYK